MQKTPTSPNFTFILVLAFVLLFQILELVDVKFFIAPSTPPAAASSTRVLEANDLIKTRH